MGDNRRILRFGEPLLRLPAPARDDLFQQNRLYAHFGGTGANDSSAVVSAAPDDAVGDGALDAIRPHGVGGVPAPGRLGLYHLVPGARTGTALARAALKHVTPGDHRFTMTRELAEFARGGLEVRR